MNLYNETKFLMEKYNIKANKNLTESNGRNDWEMMGADIKELQSLIDSLEKMVKKENSKFNVTTSDF